MGWAQTSWMSVVSWLRAAGWYGSVQPALKVEWNMGLLLQTGLKHKANGPPGCLTAVPRGASSKQQQDPLWHRESLKRVLEAAGSQSLEV